MRNESKVCLAAFTSAASGDFTAAPALNTQHMHFAQHTLPSMQCQSQCLKPTGLRLLCVMNCRAFAAHVKFSVLTETQWFNNGKQRCGLFLLLFSSV